MKPNLKQTIAFALDGLHFLALAVWLGGLVTLWLALMPAAFHGAGLTLREAEGVVGETLRRFTPLVEICGMAMIGAQFLLRRRYQSNRTLFVADGIRQMLTFGALLLAEFCLRSLLPQMNAARQVVHLNDFHQLHQQYAVMATIETIVLVGVGLLTAWLQLPRPLAVSVKAAPAPISPVPPTSGKPKDAPKPPKASAARRPARNR